MEALPHLGLLPVPQPPPARHPAAAAHLLRSHLPGNAALEDEQDAAERRTIRDTARPSAFGLGRFGWQEGRDDLLQPVAD